MRNPVFGRRIRLATSVVSMTVGLACGGSTVAADGQGDADAGNVETLPPDAESDEAADGESDDDAATEMLGDTPILDAAGWEASEYVTLPPPGGECGDGVLDPGEECDDRNRLNGDGCDWLCRVGDGDPPPEPDPDATDYVPSGDAAALPGAVPDGVRGVEGMPFVWTGAEYATAWFQPDDPVEPLAGTIRFWRFDATGRRIDTEWRMPTVNREGGFDVVWTGTGFGLFFVDGETGLWYLRLSAVGKPEGSPVLIEGDPRVRAPTADLGPDGTIVVAWIRVDEGYFDTWVLCSPYYLHSLRVRRVDLDGGRIGPVYVVDDTAQGPPDIAAGGDGFGLVFTVPQDETVASGCALRFEKLDASLEHPVYSGVLGQEHWGDVKWVAAASQWVTAWTTPWPTADAAGEMRVARFAPDGSLVGPPVRNTLAGTEGRAHSKGVRIAAGDAGLSLVVCFCGDRLHYLRTDGRGVAIAPLRDVRGPFVCPAGLCYGLFHSYNAVWAGDGFAVLYSWTDYSTPANLYLQLFTRAE